jgi:tRNA(Ile)-lysidine synthase
VNLLEKKIEQSIAAHELFRRGQSILVAVSGGLDSMVLLHLLDPLSKIHEWKISVAHLNHQLRGRSSDADERLVQKIAASLKVKFISERTDVKNFAKANRVSIEMAARKLRHEFLARTARKLKIKTIALAHHADDQVELFFLRLLRGAGTEGLSGMTWKSKSPADASIQLVRPLLDQSKERLLEFARTEKIPFREDASNASLDFQRNRIRHEVVPSFRRIQPTWNETVLRTMEIVAAESNFVLEAASEWLNGKARRPFGKLHVALQRVCLRLQLRKLGLPAHFDLVERLRLQCDRLIAIDPKNSVYRDATGIVGLRTEKAFLFNASDREIDLSKRKEVRFAGRIVSWAFQSQKGDSFLREKSGETFDAAKVGSPIRLRHWKPGDRFQPIGTKTPKKLQDIFTDLRVPRGQRHQRIIGETESGEIFWVEGLRISERFKLDKQSVRRLKWHWQCFGEVAVAGNT